MPNTRLPKSIFFALAALGAVQLSFYAPRIPEILGSHFSPGGFVNGWQTKTAFFATELAIIALATVVSFGVPRILAAVPASVINLPHKEYWLAPERRGGHRAPIARCVGGGWPGGVAPVVFGG